MDGTVYFYHCRPWQHLATCMALREVGERRYEMQLGHGNYLLLLRGTLYTLRKALQKA